MDIPGVKSGPLAHLTVQQKWLAAGLAVAVIGGLYVFWQRKKSAGTGAGTGTANTAQTVSAGSDLTGLSGELQSIIDAMTTQNKATNDNLGGLITGSDTDIVGAINNQTTGISAQLSSLAGNTATSDLATAMNGDFKTLGDNINAAFAAQNTGIGAGFKALADGFTSGFGTLGTQADANTKTLNDAITAGNAANAAQNSALSSTLQQFFTSAFGTLTAELQQQATTLAASVNSLASLTSSQYNDQESLQFLEIGEKSAAACFRSGGLHLDCVNNSIQDYTPRSGAGTGDGSNRNIFSSDLPPYLLPCNPNTVPATKEPITISNVSEG